MYAKKFIWYENHCKKYNKKQETRKNIIPVLIRISNFIGFEIDKIKIKIQSLVTPDAIWYWKKEFFLFYFKSFTIFHVGIKSCRYRFEN